MDARSANAGPHSLHTARTGRRCSTSTGPADARENIATAQATVVSVVESARDGCHNHNCFSDYMGDDDGDREPVPDGCPKYVGLQQHAVMEAATEAAAAPEGDAETCDESTSTFSLSSDDTDNSDSDFDDAPRRRAAAGRARARRGGCTAVKRARGGGVAASRARSATGLGKQVQGGEGRRPKPGAGAAHGLGLAGRQQKPQGRRAPAISARGSDQDQRGSGSGAGGACLRGVHQQPCGKWRAQFCNSGIVHQLGMYDSEVAAATVRAELGCRRFASSHQPSPRSHAAPAYLLPAAHRPGTAWPGSTGAR
jgi:hypothetical protein